MKIRTTHRKRVRHYNEPGHCHELTFSCYRRMPLLTNDDWREKLEPEHRPSDQRACLFAGRFRIHAGMIDYIHMNPVRRKLANEPVEWRWSSCRFYSAGGRCDDAALPKLCGLPSETSGPVTCALAPHREARAASCPVAPEPCRSIPGNRSSKLALGGRCVVRIFTVWDLNGGGTGGKPPVAPNVFRVSASQGESKLPVAPARS